MAEDLDAIIDLDRYPIHRLDSSTRAELVAETRAQMHGIGCARVEGFLRPDVITELAASAESLHDRTFWAEGVQNPYASEDDPVFPADHPRRHYENRTSGFIATDLLPADSPLLALHHSTVFTHFLWECLGTDRPIYPYADPIARCPFAVMDPGQYFPWHFDGNEFTVSLLVQAADEGGIFEYAPNIRRPDDECYDAVQQVLEGGRDGVRQLELTPGDLQLFSGRHSMHRVTEVTGSTTRYIALPSYSFDPWRMNRPHHSINYYGRALDVHHHRADVLVDGLVD